VSAAQLPGGLQPGHPRHRHIEHGEIDIPLAHAFERLAAIADLGDNLEVWMCLEDVAQAATNDRVVVGEHHPGSQGNGQRDGSAGTTR
jgi:hypothetical protein